MKLLVTADWQLIESNLYKAKLLVDFIYNYCEQNYVKVICHLGDLKQAYSPVDIRTINFTVKTIAEATKRNIKWIQLLGNHDRGQMQDGGCNWMRVLRQAGAVTVSKPKLITTGNLQLACVPYITDGQTLRNALRDVSASLNDHSKDDSLLFFHNTILGCKANVVSKLKEGMGTQDLFPEKYKYCIGGHIHLDQKIEDNIYYVGSPIAHDWGEVNARKRFLVYDSETGKLESIPSPIPGIYDPSWPKFEESRPKSFKGTKVRIHVPCDGSVVDLQKVLLKAKTKAEQEYKGAEITVVPEFIEQDNKIEKLSITDDEVAIQEYVESTCPPFLSQYKKQIVSYLKFKLAQKGFVRRASQTVEFLEAEGRNFLCFKKLKIDFRKKGIVVITGRNKDWPGRRNGSGKTSLMNLPSVAITGKTLKGQANDRWVRRNSKGIAFAKLRVRLQDKRKCTVSRTRRPVKLRLLINDHDRSTGIGVRGTQKAIENLTGLTADVLKNAIYIDQEEINEILKGGDTDRKAIFARLLNLERFEETKELLKNELKNIVKLKDLTEEAIESSLDKIKSLKSFIEDTDTVSDLKNAEKEYSSIKIKQGRLRAYLKRGKLDRLIRKQNRIKEKYLEKIQSNVSKRDAYLEVRGSYKKDIESFEQIKDTCPLCKQGVDHHFHKKRMMVLKRALVLVNTKLEEIDKIYNRCNRKIESAKNTANALTNEKELKKEKLESLSQIKEQTFEALTKLKTSTKLNKKYSRKLKKEKKKLTLFKKSIDAFNFDISLITYGLKCLSRDGLPAYMIRVLCPQLNIAARKYARLISEDEIKVKFITDEDGSIDIDINNAHGGEELDDQSRGETRIASIITSFAIREVINPANVLILDEPGEGLDEHNSRLFASVLKEVAKTFGVVMIATHSPIILAELEGERKLVVEKENGVARIVGV